MVNKFDESIYFRLNDVLSRNAVYNFIVGGRGIGKTFSAKEWCVRDFVKNGNQFIYLRRFNTELKTRSTWFSDFAYKFPNYGFRVSGSNAEITLDPTADKPVWKIMGFFVALSNAQSKKSVAYPDVTKIIFDEFIIEKGVVQYLSSEAKVFNDFYSTVDRYKDKTRVLFLANSVSIMNPYFLEYDIQPRGEKWVSKMDGFICCHFPQDAEFVNVVKNTRFGKFVSGTDYESYSIGNVFLDNNESMIMKKTEDAYYMFSVETNQNSFSVWRDGFFMQDGCYFIQEKRPKEERIFVLNHERMDTDKVLLTYSDKLGQNLRTAYRYGKVYFDKAATRNSFIQIFKR